MAFSLSVQAMSAERGCKRTRIWETAILWKQNVKLNYTKTFINHLLHGDDRK